MTGFQSISVGVDLTAGEQLVAAPEELAPACRAAIGRAAWLARRFGASLHVVTSIDVDAFAEELIRKQHADTQHSLLDSAAAVLDAITAPARAAGVAVTTDVAFGKPGRVLAEDAARGRRDLVVVGANSHRSVSRGRTALQLLRHCQSPLWIARPGPDEIRSVLAAVDYDDLGSGIVDVATAVAVAAGAPLRVLHVVEWDSERVLRATGVDENAVDAYRDARRRSSDEALNRLVARATAAGARTESILRSGDAADEIVAASKESAADVVVLGTRTHGGLQATIWGSVAERTLALAETSLLIRKLGSPS